MKKANIQGKEVFFNGNCKDSRISNALVILEPNQSLVQKVVLNMRGIHPDTSNIKRYVKSILNSKDNKIKVTEV